MAGVLGKSGHPQPMSFYQSMLSLPKLALTCALWYTGKSQCGLFDGKSSSLSAQANPVSLDGAWNLMRLLCLQFHSQVLPGQEHPRTKSPIEKHWVMSQNWGVGVVSAADQRTRQEEAKEIHEPVYLTQDGSV